MSKELHLTFREVATQDFPVLLRMMRSLAEHPPAIPFDEREVRDALQKFITLPEFGRAWLLHLSSELIGYVILTLGFSFEFRGTDAFIDELYIEPKYRRKGYGRRAMKFVEEEARKRGANALHLEVDGENDAAVELYRRAGYKDHGRHLMTKWLNRR